MAPAICWSGFVAFRRTWFPAKITWQWSIVKRKLSHRATLSVHLCSNPSWAVSSHLRTRSWIQAAENEFPHRVTGLGLRDRVRSSDISKFKAELLLLLPVERSQLWYIRHLLRMPTGCHSGEVIQACPSGRRSGYTLGSDKTLTLTLIALDSCNTSVNSCKLALSYLRFLS